MGRWLRCYGFDRIDKSDRSRLLRCADHLKTIDTWRSGRPLSEQLELNHPRIVYERWQRTLERDENTPTPAINENPKKPSGFTDAEWTDALRTDLGFERFLRVMPNEWRAQMELRVANQIIGREKRLYPNKQLKNLQAADRPQRGTGSSALNEVSTRSRSRSNTRRAPPRCLNRASGPPPEGRCGGRLGRNGRRDRCFQHRSRH